MVKLGVNGYTVWVSLEQYVNMLNNFFLGES